MSLAPDPGSGGMTRSASTEHAAFVILFLLFALGALPRVFESATENLYAYQAQAWLEGRLDIQADMTDVATHEGKKYVPFPPFPTLLLMPFVKVFGVNETRVVLITLLLTALNLWTCRRILGLLGIEGEKRAWLCAGILLGTGYWTVAIASAGVWAFAHIVAFTALLLSLAEALGSGRGWLVGGLLAMALLSRQLTVLSAPFLLLLIHKRAREREKAAAFQIAGFLGCVSVGVGVYLLFNEARFEDPLESGYRLIPLSGVLKSRVEAHGLFSPAYFLFNFIHFFLQGFQVWFGGENMLHVSGTSTYGTSITFASPFLFVSLWARWPRRILTAAWLSITLILACFLLYYNNGWVQTNTQRFSLDFIPLMLPMLGLGACRVSPRIWKPLVAYSVSLNMLAILIEYWIPKPGV